MAIHRVETGEYLFGQSGCYSASNRVRSRRRHEPGHYFYVSLTYFRNTDPFADYVVHEAAHVLHNCRRAAIGLAERRNCPNPLDIAFGKRETFAYACEAYSQILVSAPGEAARQAALSRHQEYGLPPDERVDHDEYMAILADAIQARNG
ncbi:MULTISPECIES: hypothetical protein [unclassified Caballeronia]|uniref:hypothetical protein n=1 Tax=unclassified Caballeronia TaxID=2646786 RepID=UPI0020288770|nr:MULTISPECIES: hypothetical protein [unclassified Caballeronia]MDR5770049.1 hypothetical protein [Caballeronia sp. LZ028]